MALPLEKIYESPNSTVYKQVETEGSPLMIKVLKTDYTNPRQILQFNNEFSILTELDIPGVRKVVSKGTYQGAPSITSRYFEGISLREYNRLHKFNLADRLYIACQVAHILGMVHQKHVIHRDLTSDNILVNPLSLEVHLVDFGQSIRIDVKTIHLSNPDLLDGSLHYFSPEQTGRMNRVVDYRSDLYSLGIIFYELFTGKVPFNEKDPLKLIHSHLAVYPPSVHEANPQVPEIVSNIIRILLAKNAEDRYQSAFGLEADLVHCYETLKEKGEIDPFELSHDKVFTKFQIPQKLYGREKEIDLLVSTFEKVSDGEGKVMLVSGYSGVGKTALVNEIHKPITAKSGFFIKGKFDQYNRNIPFNAFTQALNEYCHIILSEPEEQLSAVREKIVDALGHQGQILVDIIPDLELIIGRQAQITRLDPVENKYRLNLLLLKFFEAIATIDHPLVIFLDDLQWADSASLDLIELLASAKSSLILLLIGAYRDNEVDAQHGLTLMLNELNKNGITVFDLKVSPLPFEDVKAMIVDTLHQANMDEIARLIYDKTKGNAFFTIQFIRHLIDTGLLSFDEDQKLWVADIADIRAQAYSDNVVELMILKIRSLEESTQKTLSLASVFGNTFNLDGLSTMMKLSPEKVLDNLWPALTEGYLMPVNDNYRMFMVEELNIAPEHVLFSFSHDRIQQASYQLIPEAERKALHLDIGRMLYAKFADHDEYLFDIAGHYYAGRDLIKERTELQRIRKINIKAGLKAKLANAVTSSIRHLTFARQLTTEQDWTEDYKSTLLLNRELAEAYYLNGKLDLSEKLLQECLERANNAIDKADIYHVLMLRLSLVSKYDETLDEAVNGLRELGYVFPKETNWEEINVYLNKIIAHFHEHPIPEMANIPLMTDPISMAVIKILDNLSTPLYVGGKTELWILHALHKVWLSIEKGMTNQMSYAFSEFGLICCILGMYEYALPAGDLARDLSFRFEKEALRQKGRTGHIVANYVYPYFKHLREINQYNQIAYKANLESGELIFAGYTLFHAYFNHFFTSEKTIQELMAEFEPGIEYNAKINHLLALHSLLALEMCAHSLVDKEMIGKEVNSSRYDVDSFMEMCLGKNEYYGPVMISLYSLFVYSLFGDYERAKEADKNAAKYIAPIIASAAHYGSYMFFHCLLHLELKLKGLSTEIPSSVDDFMKKMETYSPPNFKDKLLLLQALRYRIEGEETKAFDSFEAAIKAASEGKFVHMVALANEKLGDYWLHHQRKHYAAYHIQQAIIGYTQWGAFAKVAQLQDEHKDIVTTSEADSELFLTVSSSSDTIHAEKLDMMSVFKASQALSGLLTMDELKKAIIDIVMEAAGASRVALVVPNVQQTLLEVLGDIDGTYYGDVQPVNKAGNLIPVSLINFVLRKKEQVIINELSEDRVFNRDPYFQSATPQSVWAIPLMVQNELKGVLYLENKHVRGAFTSHRVNILQLLSYQLGISLDNARMYENLKSTNTIYQKFVPLPFLQTIGHSSILDVKLGDQIQREMTIMFSDIRSYTTISELLTPEENFRFINEYLSYTAPCVEAHGGFINQFTGDGIMALFSNAEHALKAAISLQHSVAEYNKIRVIEGEPPIKIGVGLHTGLIMLGVIGDEDRHDTGVISNEVTTAARIEGLTKMFDATILLSESTINNIVNRHDFNYRHLGSVQVKGKTASVKVYECFDGETPEIIHLKKETMEDFTAGLNSYLAKDFIVAAGHLKKVLNVHPKDVTAERYFRHAAELMVKGVGPEWSGVEIMTEK
jgi:predicted ATPase/class 3 adenylate cyclase